MKILCSMHRVLNQNFQPYAIHMNKYKYFHFFRTNIFTFILMDIKKDININISILNLIINLNKQQYIIKNYSTTCAREKMTSRMYQLKIIARIKFHATHFFALNRISVGFNDNRVRRPRG